MECVDLLLEQAALTRGKAMEAQANERKGRSHDRKSYQDGRVWRASPAPPNPFLGILLDTTTYFMPFAHFVLLLENEPTRDY